MFQAVVDGSYDDFVDHVATSREIPSSTIIDELGAGVFTAADAVANRLIDETGNFDQAKAVAVELAGIVGEFDVREVTPDLGFLFAQNEPEPADLSRICSSTPTAHVFFGDLSAWCAQN